LQPKPTQHPKKLKYLKENNLKTRILVPLALGLSVLLGVFIFNAYRAYYKEISNNVEKRLETVDEFLETHLSLEEELLTATIEMLSANQRIQDAWLAKDRPKLLELTSPLLQNLRNKYNVTHLYFHDIDRVNFLRVHKPEMRGDLINRFTLLEAKKSCQEFAGIEVGPLGTLALRVVKPWRINGEVVGYIEIGQYIEHITKELQEIVGVEVYVSIYKKILVQKEWEIGMQMLGKHGNWDQLPSSVIVSQTLKVVPKILNNYLAEGQHEYMEMAPDLELSLESRLYRVGVIPFFDAGEREIGDVVILYDVTERVSDAKHSMLIISAICVAVGIVLFLLFSMILGRMDRKMKALQLELIDDSCTGNATQKLHFKDSERKLASALALPIRVTIIIGISTFIAESIIMLLFYILPQISPIVKMFLDSFLLVGLVSPVLYYFLFRPLINNIAELKRGYVDPEGLILDVNKSFLKMTGYSKKELLDGRKYQDITPEKYHQYEAEKIGELLNTGKPQEFEKEYIRKDGSRVPVLTTVFIVRKSEGKPPILATIIKDMSERKRMEKEKEKLETKFYKAQRMEAIGTLAVSVAHEMNNPLATISFGLLNLKHILDEKEQSEFKKEFLTYYDKIDSEIERCQRIVSNLLSFARDTAKKEFTDVDLLGVLKNTVDLLSFEAQSKKIRFHYSFPEDPLFIRSDEGFLRQIFSNLLKNAFDAMDNKGTITLCANSNRDGKISLSFKDNGSGISEENLNNIFKPLFTTKPRGEGTGLGLPICKKITDSLGGKLTCKSREGGGSTFTLTLPVQGPSQVET
jgi:PAS domain S-box-containing protein